MSRRTLSLLLLIICSTWTLGNDQARKGDWPQFRGPERNGISSETGLLQSWPKEGPKLLWKVGDLGQGYSSVAIANGRIYLMGDRANNGGKDAFVIALNLADGKELWAGRVGGGFNNNQGGGPRCTPTVDGERVYGISASGDLACLDAATGKPIWSKSFPKDFGGRMQKGWGYSESPLVDGDKLICTPGGRDATIVALNKTTGDVIWKAKTPAGDASSYCSMVATEVGGVRQYVQIVEKGLIGVAAKDGKFLWRYDRVANQTANIASPIVKDDLVFASTAYSTGSALLRLVPKNGGIACEEVYFLNARDLQNHHGGVVLVNGHIYGGHGQNAGAPTCIDFATGKVKWKERGPGSGSAAILYADGNLYFRYQDGTMALIETNPDKYVEKAKFKLPFESGRPSWPHPVIHQGKLYVRDQENLACFDVRGK